MQWLALLQLWHVVPAEPELEAAAALLPGIFLQVGSHILLARLVWRRWAQQEKNWILALCARYWMMTAPDQPMGPVKILAPARLHHYQPVHHAC